MCRAGAFDVRILFFFLRVRIAPGSAEGGHQIHDVLRVVEVHGRCLSIDGAFHVGELIGECIGVVTGFDDFGFAGGSVCDFCFPGTGYSMISINPFSQETMPRFGCVEWRESITLAICPS